MRYRAVWHSNRYEILRSASLMYLDVRSRAGIENYAYSVMFKADGELLDVTRDADGTELFGTAFGRKLSDPLVS
eukprot:1823556-Pyramimonas_sp.AAC.1